STQASRTGNGTVGITVLSDTATLTGGFDPTGSIDFTVTDPNGNVTDLGTVAVNGDGTYTAPNHVHPATLFGVFTFSATSPSDTILILNDTATAENDAVTLHDAIPILSTQASRTGNGTVGITVLSDTATLTGGFDPTGSIDFTVTDPNGNVTDLGTVAVN